MLANLCWPMIVLYFAADKGAAYLHGDTVGEVIAFFHIAMFIAGLGIILMGWMKRQGMYNNEDDC